eukprot:Selendium_serpulae@DN5876_c0_g2_i1.p1
MYAPSAVRSKTPATPTKGSPPLSRGGNSVARPKTATAAPKRASPKLVKATPVAKSSGVAKPKLRASASTVNKKADPRVPPVKLKSSTSGIQSLSVALERCDCGAADAMREVERLYYQIKIGGDSALSFAKSDEKRLESDLEKIETIEIPGLEMENIPIAERVAKVKECAQEINQRNSDLNQNIEKLVEQKVATEAAMKNLNRRELEIIGLHNDLQSELSKVDAKEAPLIMELRQRQDKLKLLESKFGERCKETALLRTKLEDEKRRLTELTQSKHRLLNDRERLSREAQRLEREAAALDEEEKKAKMYFDSKLAEYREYELLDGQLKSREKDLNDRLEQLAQAEERHHRDQKDYDKRMKALNLSEQRHKELKAIGAEDEYTTGKRREVQHKLKALQAKHDLWEQNYDIHEQTLQQLQGTMKDQDEQIKLLRRNYAYLLESRGLTESQFLNMYQNRRSVVHGRSRQ